MIKVRVVKIAEIDPDTVSAAIMAATDDNGSHVATFYKGMAYEAIFDGVVCNTIEKALEGSMIVDEEEVELPCSEAEFFRHFKKYEGSRYAFAQALGQLLPFTRRFLSNGRKKFMCYEWVACQMQDLGGFWELADEGEWMNQKTLIPRIRELKAKRKAA